MLKSSFCDHCDANILVKTTVSVDGKGADINDKQVIFETSYPFIDCISRSLSKKVVEVRFWTKDWISMTTGHRPLWISTLGLKNKGVYGGGVSLPCGHKRLPLETLATLPI